MTDVIEQAMLRLFMGYCRALEGLISFKRAFRSGHSYHLLSYSVLDYLAQLKAGTISESLRADLIHHLSVGIC